MWGQNMNIDNRDLREVQTKRSQYSLLAHYITTDWLTASYGDFFIGFRPPLSVPLVCMWGFFSVYQSFHFPVFCSHWLNWHFLKAFLASNLLNNDMSLRRTDGSSLISSRVDVWGHLSESWPNLNHVGGSGNTRELCNYHRAQTNNVAVPIGEPPWIQEGKLFVLHPR